MVLVKPHVTGLMTVSLAGGGGAGFLVEDEENQHLTESWDFLSPSSPGRASSCFLPLCKSTYLNTAYLPVASTRLYFPAFS